MIINESEPWLLWPDMVSYEINKNEIGKTFEGDTDFTISMRVKILSKGPEKRTLFAKLPNYMGIDIEKENNNLLFICNFVKNNEIQPKYLFIGNELGWDFNFITVRYFKKYRKLEVMINDLVVLDITLENGETLSVGNDPHIIFGSGNFPKNNFNLNYCSFESDYLIIAKNYLSFSKINQYYNKEETSFEGIVGLYDFNKKTDYKVYDLTGNCNFIHKII